MNNQPVLVKTESAYLDSRQQEYHDHQEIHYHYDYSVHENSKGGAWDEIGSVLMGIFNLWVVIFWVGMFALMARACVG